MTERENGKKTEMETRQQKNKKKERKPKEQTENERSEENKKQKKEGLEHLSRWAAKGLIKLKVTSSSSPLVPYFPKLFSLSSLAFVKPLDCVYI